MPIQKFYPPVSDLIDASAIPGDFMALEDAVQQGVDMLLGKIYYKDFVVSISPSGDSRQYSLTLLTKTLRLPLFADFNLVFFKGSETNMSEFPIIFKWEWALNKYIKNFQHQGFSYAPEAFIDIFIELAEIKSRKDFLNQIIEVFFSSGDGTYTNFFVAMSSQLNNYANGNPLVTSEIQIIQDNLTIIKEQVTIELNSGNSVSIKTLFENYEANSILNEAVEQILNSIEILSTTYNIHINFFGDVIACVLLNFSDIGEKLNRLVALFKKWLSDITIEDVKKLLIPQFFFQLNGIAMALEFPRSVLQPMIQTSPGVWAVDPDETKKADVRFTSGPLRFDSKTGFEIDFDSNTLSLPRCRVGNTQLELEFLGIKLDLSRKKNIPEAIADGRPEDFIGVYITEGNIYLPTSWNHDSPTSTGQVKVRNFLVGTGGVSGTIGMEAKLAGNPAPLLKANFGGGFSISLDAFDITFKQNTILSSNIKGTLKIPGFKDAAGNDAEINIKIWLGQNGDFSVTASETQGITAITIPNILKVNIKSLTVGRKNNKMYVAVSGTIDFMQQSAGSGGSFIQDNLPKDIEIQKLLIWQDGSFEFEGGGIELRKPLTMKIGPVALSITAIHFGSHEQEHNGLMRKYKFFGFDGGVSIKPGGVDARGDGIKFYFTVDNGPGKPLDVFMRIQSIAIDLVIPGTATPETAAVILKGYLAMKTPTGGSSSAGTEYAGSIELTLPKLKIAGSAAMRYNPSVPSFIVDIGLELPSALPLGSTGLGIYGFRGLFGLRYVASREYVGLPADAEWWQYYKKKVAPDNKEGIFINKMEQRAGTAIGAGVSLSTLPDGGRTFSTKLFFMLSLPDVFLLQGQAAILSKRIGLNDPNDPPFFALIAISSTSIEAALGVNYKIPNSGSNLGKIVTVTGVLELGFFWGNSFSWYLNLGKETPEDRRIRARIFNLFDCYFFLMISSQGIYTGAGASYNFNKSFLGVVKVKLQAYMDIRGKISFKPLQIGGSIQLGASIEIKVFGIGFGLSADAGLAAEAPKPFVISGFIRVKFKVLWKTFSFNIEFSWTFSNELDLSEVPIMDEVIGNIAKAINAHTKEAFPIYIQRLTNTASANPNLASLIAANIENFTIPQDSFIDIEFKQGMHATGADASLAKFNGITSGFEYTAMIPPQKGKSKQVKHEFFVDKVELKIWNPQSNTWADYHPYKAMSPLANLPNLDISPYATFDQYVDAQNLKFGSWQVKTPNKYNVLRVMATNPLSYMTQGLPLIPEELQITSETLFCTDPPREKICVNLSRLGRERNGDKNDIYVPANQSLMLDGILFRLIGTDGQIISQTFGGLNRALRLLSGELLEIYPPEAVSYTSLMLQATAANVVITYYKRIQTGLNSSSAPVFGWQLISVVSRTAAQLANPVEYQSSSVAIDKIVVKAGPCPKKEDCVIYEERLVHLEEFLNVLIRTKRLGNGRQISISTGSLAPFYAPFLQPGVLWDNIRSRSFTILSRFNDDYSIYILVQSKLPAWRCEFTLVPNEPVQLKNGTFIRFFDLKIDTSVNSSVGVDFTVSAEVLINGVKRIFTFKGKSCVILRQCKGGGGSTGGTISIGSGTTSTPIKNGDSFLAVLQSLAKQKRIVQTRKLNITSGIYAKEFTRIKDLNLFKNKGSLYYEAEQVSSNDISMRFRFDNKQQYIKLETNEAVSAKFAVSSIIHFDNLRIDETKSSKGKRYYFLIDAATKKEKLTLQGETNIVLETVELPKLLPPAISPTQDFECGELTPEAKALGLFLSTLARLKHLSSYDPIQLISYSKYQTTYFDTPLFPPAANPELSTWQVIEKTSSYTVINANLQNFINREQPINCLFHLEMAGGSVEMDFRQLINIVDIRSNPQVGQSGTTYHFTATGIFIVNGNEARAPIWGYSCYPIAQCETRKCNVTAFRFCYLPEADYQYNQTIPSLSVVQQNSQSMAQAMSKLIQPIWRPQSVFAIRFHTRDRLTADGAQQAEYSNAYFLSFKTAGSIGHFHQYVKPPFIDPSATLQTRADYQALLTKDREEEFKLASLKHYVDMDKSYPNADGRLTLAKPLFYRNPKLLLFFVKEYVYGMYADWDVYAGNVRWNSNLQASIIDPTDNPTNPAVFYVDAEWEKNQVPYITTDESTLVNFLANGVVCTTNIQITKFGLNTFFKVPELIPLKTYAARFSARFKKQSDAAYKEREVHRYVFATSRYATFEEQINSYITLTEYDPINTALITHQEKAFYRIDLPLVAADVTRVQSILSATDTDALRTQFIHIYDRLMDGGFKMPAQEAPITTEFNIMRNTANNQILGILIRNPEPFNDPKIPTTTLNSKKIVELSVNGGASTLFKCVYAKDIAAVFITKNNNDLTMPMGTYSFTFRYLEYNPNTKDYDVVSSVSAITLTVS